MDEIDRHFFREGLIELLNKNSLEDGSDTPDYILADYLIACLDAFDEAVKFRTGWYSKGKEPAS